MARTYNSGWRDWFNTAHADIGNAFIAEGFVELSQKLDQLQAKNPEMEKKIKGIISKALGIVRKNVGDAMRARMDSDPRGAYKAVRRTVYRRILGGNINILQNKRRGSASSYQPTRTLKTKQRGGNRRTRSDRTMRMDSYDGKDRGFILRFLESGARVGGGRRQLRPFENVVHRADVKRGSQGGNVSKYGKTVNTGNRGSIPAQHIFSDVAEHGLENSIQYIEQEIDKLIRQEFGSV